jgi:phosphate/phosphite/phosphonate ABC transporter binding protein
MGDVSGPHARPAAAERLNSMKRTVLLGGVWAVVASLAVLASCTDTPRSDGRGLLRVAGSAVARDVVGHLLADFAASRPGVVIRHLPSSHTPAALQALRAGEIDLAYLAREPGPDERGGLFVYPFASEPIVFAAHRGTGVLGLSTRQLRELYSGKVRNWAELGGADQPVVLLDRPEFSATKRLLRGGPFGDLAIEPGAAVLEGEDLMESALEAYPGALGYTSLRSALALGEKVDVLRLDGVYPDGEAVGGGRYRLSRALAFAVRDPVSPQSRAFLDFAASEAGRRVLAAHALIPLRREIRVAVPPMRDVVSLELKYGGLARYLQERLGRPVELVHQPTYTALVEAFRANQVDAALLGSFTYILTHLEAGVQVLARPEYAGVSHYRGVFYVRAGSPYRRVEDLAGLRLVHSGKATTAGYLWCLYALRTRGLPAPEAFFGSFVDAGSHEGALRAVLDGRADVAAAKDLVYQEMAAAEPGLRGALREVAASPPVPSNGFAAGPLLTPELKEQIRGLLLSMDQTPRGRKALSDLGAERFLATSDADYANLYEMVGAVSDQLADFFHYR